MFNVQLIGFGTLVILSLRMFVSSLDQEQSLSHPSNSCTLS
jgi:hypothetical protein